MSAKEYYSSGHELDVFAVTLNGVSIYVEIIWSDASSHFLRDVNMIQQSDAQVKILVTNPRILAREEYVREFSKIAVSQRKIGFKMHGELLDGQRIMYDSEFLEKEFKRIVFSLIEEVGPGKVQQKNIIKSADLISATLHPLVGDVTPSKLFSGIPSKLGRKSEQIYFILSNARDIDDFIVRLSPLIRVHRRYFNAAFKDNFNRILKNLEIRLDDGLNIVKIA